MNNTRRKEKVMSRLQVEMSTWDYTQKNCNIKDQFRHIAGTNPKFLKEKLKVFSVWELEHLYKWMKQERNWGKSQITNTRRLVVIMDTLLEAKGADKGADND